jgi:predicted transposase/invertase (TIGR01784 family)
MNIFDKAYEDGRIDGIEEGIEKGIIEGAKQTSIETAKKMLSMGKFSIDDIAESTSLPIETIKELAG